MTNKTPTFNEIQEITKHNRERLSNTEFRKGLYDTIMYFIIQFAKNGKTKHIHPVDRELWDDQEIEFAKWKLDVEGYTVTHKYNNWLGKLFAAITSQTEMIIIDWGWPTDEAKHFLMD